MDRFVVDTCSLINYYNRIFGERRRISKRAAKIIESAFDPWSSIFLIIPSIVFVEIFDIFFHRDEFSRRIYYEMLVPILDCGHIEIRPIDADTLYALARVKQGLSGHEMHDKIILSTAVALECELLTYDPRLVTYVQDTGIIPGVCT